MKKKKKGEGGGRKIKDKLTHSPLHLYVYYILHDKRSNQGVIGLLKLHQLHNTPTHACMV
jgi:hypothetical protein